MTFCQASFTLTTPALHDVLFHFSLLDYCISLCELLNSCCTSTQHDWNDVQAVGDKYRQTQMDMSLPATNSQLGPSVRVAVWLCFVKTVFDQGWVSPVKPAKFCCSGNTYYCICENICEMHGNTKVIWVKCGKGMEKGKLNCTYEKLQMRSMIH